MLSTQLTVLEDSQISLQKILAAAEGVLTWMAGGLLSRTPLCFAPSVNCMFSKSRRDGSQTCLYWLNVIVIMRFS